MGLRPKPLWGAPPPRPEKTKAQSYKISRGRGPSPFKESSLNRLAGLLAGATLYIYLTHWQDPLVDGHSEVLALPVSIGAGIAYAALATRVMRLLRRSNPAVRQAL
ncbi:hypothetical protein [Spirillospora sp. CA-294931]|uniref:hypothetical protein n=1 Tax=Spirillospora sp. CA-294931 TaxID=3240042 RepID=UPI003D90C033